MSVEWEIYVSAELLVILNAGSYDHKLMKQCIKADRSDSVKESI